MSTYTDTWEDRYKHMGDEAEGAFCKVAQHTGINIERFGLNRPSFGVGGLPEHIRYMPDYITRDFLVECKGVGRDGVLKVKCAQWVSLLEWDAFLPVWVFIYNSANLTYSMPDYWTVDMVVREYGEVKKFPEGNDAHFVPLSRLETSWHVMPT